MSTVLFSLGRCTMTVGAQEKLESINFDPILLLRRHQSGDWHEMSKADQTANRDAIIHGSRVFSAYKLTDANVHIWVITEADRSSTAILLPSEY